MTCKQTLNSNDHINPAIPSVSNSLSWCVCLMVFLFSSMPALAGIAETQTFVNRNGVRYTLAELSKLQETKAAQYRANHLYLLHAQLLKEKNHYNDAITLLEKWEKQDRVFLDYILMEKAKLSLAKGKGIPARKNLYAIVNQHRHSPYCDDAYFMLAKSYQDDKKYQLAARTFVGYLKKKMNRRLEASLHLTQIRIVQKDWRKARINLKRNLTAKRGARYRLQAALLIVKHPQLLNYFSKSETLLAKVVYTLYSNREVKALFPVLKDLLKRYPRSKKRPQYTYWMGRYYFFMAKYDTALLYYRKAASYGDESITIQSHLSMSRVLSLTNRDQEALTRLEKLIQTFPPAQRAGSIWQTLHNLARRLDKKKLALSYLQKGADNTSGTWKKKLLYKLAHFYLGEENYTKAAQVLELLIPKLSTKPGRKLPGKSEARFFLGLSLQKSARLEKALKVWTDGIYCRESYYSFLCMEHAGRLMARESKIRKKLAAEYWALFQNLLKRKRESSALSRLSAYYFLTGDSRGWSLGLTKLSRYKVDFQELGDVGDLPDKPFSLSPKISHTNKKYFLYRAQIFQRLGMANAAAVEYSRISDKFLAGQLDISIDQAALNKSYTLARLFQQTKLNMKAYSWSYKMLRKYPSSTPFDKMNPKLLKLCYPDLYKNHILSFCRKYDVDPRFVFSVILQESRFDPNAHSPVAARGLMQLMASTARNVARANHVAMSKNKDDLYDPELNLQLGILYLRDLLKKLEHPGVVASAYNAGEAQAKLWHSLARQPLDHYFIPEITFSQTRQYTVLVLANARMYGWLYPELSKVLKERDSNNGKPADPSSSRSPK